MQGRLEERLPFFIISFPEWFRNKYPTAIDNLKQNAYNRLTTPFDVHETLFDIMHYKNQLAPNTLQIREQSLLNENETLHEILTMYKNTKKYKRGISLFLPIQSSRTCNDAGITPHWCTCQVIYNILINTQHIINY